MTNKSPSFTLISDPGHGWLSVPLKLIQKLNLSEKISPYSYMTTSRAYLEEDVDLSVLINTLDKVKIPYEIKNSYTEKTNIRNLPSYNPELVDFALSIQEGTAVSLYNSREKTYNIQGEITKIDKNNIYIETKEGLTYKTTKNKILSIVKPFNNKTTSVESNNIKFNIKIITKDDKYGLNNCLTHNQDRPLVEFYDTRYPHTPYGQFVTRYYLDTLINREPQGLDLQGDISDWKIDKEAFTKVQNFLFENKDSWIPKQKNKNTP